MKNKDKLGFPRGEKMTVSLTRNSSFTRTLHLGEVEVDEIFFYSRGKVIYHCARGWLEDHKSRQDITQITLLEPPKKAIKVDLNRTDNFYVKGRRDYKFDKGYNFYINIDKEDIKITDLGRELFFENEFEKNEQNVLRIDLSIPFKRYEPFKLGKDAELQYREIEIKSITVTNDFINTRKTKGKEAESLLEDFKKISVTISRYDIEKILEHYDIKKKGVKNANSSIK